MSDNINDMNFKQLRNEVQLLRDELAIMKRKYEDIIYNLDTDNFSSRFVKEQGNMRTAIEVNAEGIKTKVSNEEFESSKTQTAEKIESEVKKLTDADTELSSTITQTAEAIRSEVKTATETLDGKFENYSTIEQTAKQISASVAEVKTYAEGYVTDALANSGYVTNATLKSQLDIYANGIYSEVSEIYETKESADASYSSLQGSVSSISQTASRISSRVSDVENGEFGGYTLFEQTSSKFTFVGDVEMSGNAIVGGIITGASFQNSLETTKLLLGSETGSSVGDLTLVRVNSSGTETSVFSVYDGFSGIGLNALGANFLYTSGVTTYPQGNWDFSECTSVDFGDFVSSGGGTVVAVFG